MHRDHWPIWKCGIGLWTLDPKAAIVFEVGIDNVHICIQLIVELVLQCLLPSALSSREQQFFIFHVPYDELTLHFSLLPS